MAKNKRKLTKVEQDYNRNRRRIKQFIRRAEKRGFVFPEFTMPDRPNKITKKAVKELERWTPKKFYEKGYYKTSWTGEVVPAIQGRKMESQAAYRRGVERKESRDYAAMAGPPRIEDKVLQEVQDILDRFPDAEETQNLFSWQMHIAERHHSMVQGIFESQLMREGRTRMAIRLNAAQQDVATLLRDIIYRDSDDPTFQVDLASFIAIIRGEALSANEAQMVEELASSYEE